MTTIGIFDSGIGGLTVVQSLLEKLPRVDIVYFGDTARCPYGEKSPEMVTAFSLEISQFLRRYPLNLLVVACGTASACALETLRRALDIPVIGVIDSAIEAALTATVSGRIAVLATTTTIQSSVYQQKLLAKDSSLEIFPLACPGFVPLLEQAYIDRNFVRKVVKESLVGLQGSQIDTAILGCTHYPLLAHLIAEELGPNVTLVNISSCCGQRIAQLCQQKNDGEARRLYFVSEDPAKFQALSHPFFGAMIPSVEQVNASYATR